MTVIQEEINKFNQSASQWWDPYGEAKSLHAINPCRLAYIEQFLKPLKNKKILDLGCGAGLLTEALYAKGAQVKGTDASPAMINAAKAHAQSQAFEINYQCATSADLIEQKTAPFDAVVCMELIEHVSSPQKLIFECAQLLKPQGLIFISTLDRTLKSYISTILIAEYVLRLLPLGTHNYKQLIRPHELAGWLRAKDIQAKDIKGIIYNPLFHQARLSQHILNSYIYVGKKQ